jgi:hypothetical protein
MATAQALELTRIRCFTACLAQESIRQDDLAGAVWECVLTLFWRDSKTKAGIVMVLVGL